MKKGIRLICGTVLGAALLLPFVGPGDTAKAQDYSPYNSNYYQPGYSSWDPYGAYNPYGYGTLLNSYGYNYFPGYVPITPYGPAYGWGTPLYYPAPNYANNGYSSLNSDRHYRYENGYHYYVLDDGNYYVYENNRWVYHTNESSVEPPSSYERLRADSHYRYENGYHYYVLDNGNYYVYENNRWVYHAAETLPNPSTGYDRLREDSHYRYENGYHYYVMDDGSYYYFSNGQWVYVKNETPSPDPVPDPTPEPDPTPTPDPMPSPDPTPTPDPTPSPDPEPTPENPAPRPTPDPDPTPGVNFGDLDKPDLGGEEPSQPLPVFPTPDPNLSGLEHPGYVPNANIDYDRLPKPTLPPTDPRMQADPHFVDSAGTYYYIVALTDEARAQGIDGYYKWMGANWKLFNGTGSDDPSNLPTNHDHTEDSEYSYDDKASNFKNYSENVIGTGKAGMPLPFQTLEEFKKYVERYAKPVFKDNAGWDAKVTWSIEDEDGFKNSKDSAWARDYVLVADLKSGVEDEKFKDVELGQVKFIYRVESDGQSNWIEYEKGKEALNLINKERKDAGLKELTWSDDLYYETALPQAHKLTIQYDSDGIVDRRTDDPALVVKHWLSSGQRDFLLDPDKTEVAIACVIRGDGTYFWNLRFK